MMASLRHRWGNALFVLPFLVVYIVLMIVPVGRGIWLSLHEIDLLADEASYVGFDNYINLWQDEIFRGAIWNTVYFVALSTPAFVVLSATK